MAEVAAIRFNNPGAMWGKGNKIATKWGATGTTTLNDGLGQGNNIAFFPTKIAGACAQFDLWRSGYCNMTLANAIKKWSGGNWSQPYADFLTQHTGLSMDIIVTPTMLAGPKGWQLMKYQAQWESGKPYPMSDTDWQIAQRKVFPSAPKPPRLLGTRTGQLATASAIGTAVSTVAAVTNTLTTTTQTIQNATDMVTAAKGASDTAIVVIQSVKPFFGILPETWRHIAIGAGIITMFFIAGIFWYRHVKLRDTGV